MQASSNHGAPWLRLHCDEHLGPHRVQHSLALAADWVSIFGASGSGKTTLLRLLAGLLPQRTGTCLVHGRELRGLPPHRRRIALVDQAVSVFPHLTVEQNVGFARNTARQHLQTILDRFRLTHVAKARAGHISGGEAQRVVIARAIFSQPELLLLDESFSGLDRELRDQLRTTLIDTQAECARERRPMSIITVTHDVGEVFATAKEVLRMHNGCIVAQGSPDQVLAEEREALLQRLSVA